MDTFFLCFLCFHYKLPTIWEEEHLPHTALREGASIRHGRRCARFKSFITNESFSVFLIDRVKVFSSHVTCFFFFFLWFSDFNLQLTNGHKLTIFFFFFRKCCNNEEVALNWKLCMDELYKRMKRIKNVENNIEWEILRWIWKCMFSE